MQSRFIVNVILFVVVIVLIFNLYIVNNSSNTSNTILTDINPGEIKQISIRHNKRVTTLKKDKDAWEMIEPINISADSFRVDTILKILQTPTYGSYITDGLDLDKYGLDQPTTTIKFDDIEISFGILNPVSNYRYVKTDKKISLIDDNFYPLLSSQIGTLVARTLLAEDAKVKKLVLPGQILELDKNNKWTSSRSMSADILVDTISSWKNDQAFGVHNYIERKSLGNIEVYLSNQTNPIIFKITDTEPWLVIARPDLDIEYHFNTEFYNRLIKPGSKKEPENNPDSNNQQDTRTVQPEEFFTPLQQ